MEYTISVLRWSPVFICNTYQVISKQAGIIMSSQSTNNLAPFEDSIRKIPAGETRQNILGFLQYLNSLGMVFAGNTDDGRVIYKGKKVCDFHISGDYSGYPGPWTVWMTGDFGTETECLPDDTRLMEIAWANVHPCDNCGGSSVWCGTDKRRKVFGRDFENLCVSPIAFTGSDSEAVGCMKKMAKMRKQAIDARSNDATF